MDDDDKCKKYISQYDTMTTCTSNANVNIPHINNKAAIDASPTGGSNQTDNGGSNQTDNAQN